MRLGSRPFACISVAALAILAAASPMSLHAQESAEQALGRRANEIVAQFKPSPAPPDSIFAQSFTSHVAIAQLTTALLQYYQMYGTVTSITRVDLLPLPPGAIGAAYQLRFSRGYTVPMQLGIESSPPYRIAVLSLGGAVRASATLEEVTRDLAQFPGTVSFLVARLDADRAVPIASLHPTQALAIGSAFKLYTLAALVQAIERGERRWTDVVPLDSAAISLPSGILQQWPVGSPLTLHTLATLMISQSDNTAADQLRLTLGQERLRAALTATGNSAIARNTPFLSTRELFRLRGPGLAQGRPTDIDTHEWFASAEDLVRAMRWLRDHTEQGPAAAGRAILAINPGLALTPGRWSYIGFKGGAEPGVLNLTFLLRARDGRWYVATAGWNNPAAPVNAAPFTAVVQRAIELIP